MGYFAGNFDKTQEQDEQRRCGTGGNNAGQKFQKPGRSRDQRATAYVHNPTPGSIGARARSFAAALTGIGTV